MNFWKRLSRIGVTDGMDFRLASRVTLSNQFAFIIALLTLVFMTTSFSRNNFNIIPFLVLFFIAAIIWICNHANLTRLSRLVTSLTPAAGLLFMNMSLKFSDPSRIDILHYATPRMLILGSAVLPFTMFTPPEKKYVWTAVSLILILAFGYDSIHNAAGVDYQSLGLKNNFYGVIYEDLAVLAVMVLLSSGFMFSLGNQYDLKNESLLKDALTQTEELRRNEEKIRKTMIELEESRTKDEQRNWVSKGIAGMVTILQSGEETQVIMDKILCMLVKYAGMNQGALFITEENESGETILRMASCYAYDRKKFFEKTIEPGTGLVGQVYLEAERCYLKEVPSGLSRSLPDWAKPHQVIL